MSFLSLSAMIFMILQLQLIISRNINLYFLLSMAFISYRICVENYGVKIRHMRCVPIQHLKERDVVKNHIHTDL